MRYRTPWALALSLVLAVAVSGAQKTHRRKATSTETTSRAILSVLDNQVAAWNRHDLEGFMAGYRNSDRLSFYSGGTKTSGWKTTLERYRNRYQSEGREMGHLEFTDLEVEPLGPDTAFVRGHWDQLRGSHGGGHQAEQPGNDRLARLERLADLHARGAITDEEYASQKAEILASS